MANTPLPIGTVVYLRSGGWPMVVTEVDGDWVAADWQTADGLAQTGTFPLAALELDEPPSRPDLSKN